MLRLVPLLLMLAACPGPGSRPPPKTPTGPVTGEPRPPDQPDQPGKPPTPPTQPTDDPRITWKRVETVADVPPTPAIGTYQIHLIDVGTGLAILIRGVDFDMLYDAGTNDKDEKPLRVVSYLAASLGASGDDLCVEKGNKPAGTRRKLAHVVLSHPHLDHASALDLVAHCFAIGDFWDSGRVNDTVFYRELLAGISRAAARYHTAADVPADKKVTVKQAAIKIPNWVRFSEGDTVELGEGARFTILHASAKKEGDPNDNSVVVAVDLGGVRLLLVGDSESGARKDPKEPIGAVEQHLVDHHAKQIRVDILQVGHHGSKTSSRRAFLEAVKPSLALVSSGPKMYGKVTLPDREVLDALTAVGAKILRTDERDANCPVRGRIGGDQGPGGCDSWVITVAP